MALEEFCASMGQITKLNLSAVLRHTDYDIVLMAISRKMKNLTSLNISQNNISSNAIKYLIPTEDRGCPSLAYLNLGEVSTVDLDSIKEIVIGLQNLKCLKHSLFLDSLVGLTEEQMKHDTARSLENLTGMFCKRHNRLLTAPVYQRLYNLTVVDLRVRTQASHLILHLLLPLGNVKSLTLYEMANSHLHLLPVLEENGNQLEYLCLIVVSGNLTVNDVMRTCPNLVELEICNWEDHNISTNQGVSSNIKYMLHSLKKITLLDLDKYVCSRDTILCLLQSCNLQHINLNFLEVMCDDVMFRALSRPHYIRGCAPLLEVEIFELRNCLEVTAEPFVSWIGMRNFFLKILCFEGCDKIDVSIVQAAARECSHGFQLNVIE